MRRLLLVIASAAAVFTACGKSDPDSEETSNAGRAGASHSPGVGGALGAAGAEPVAAGGSSGAGGSGSAGAVNEAGGEAGEAYAAGGAFEAGAPGAAAGQAGTAAGQAGTAAGQAGTAAGQPGAAGEAGGGPRGVVFSSDFAFGDGSPFEGSADTECGRLTLSSTNTEAYGDSSFRDMIVNAEVATISLSFTEPINDFVLRVGRVFPDESIGTFNIAPASVTGDLTLSDDVVSTVRDDDYASGEIVWSRLGTRTLEFTIDAPNGALAVNGFTVACGR